MPLIINSNGKANYISAWEKRWDDILNALNDDKLFPNNYVRDMTVIDTLDKLDTIYDTPEPDD